MSYAIGEMTIGDYDEVLALWEACEGVGLSDADSREGIASFLNRNPGLGHVARDGNELVGAVLCGSDGRRGYIHHLAVSHYHRHHGLGRALVERCLDAASEERYPEVSHLRLLGQCRCHRFLEHDWLDTEGGTDDYVSDYCERGVVRHGLEISEVSAEKRPSGFGSHQQYSVLSRPWTKSRRPSVIRESQAGELLE